MSSTETNGKTIRLAWIGGRITDATSPALTVMDQAYLSGMGVFETVRAERGEPMFLPAHMKRLAQSASIFGLEPPPLEDVRKAIRTLLKLQEFESGRVRITLSNRIGTDGTPFRTGGRTDMSVLIFPTAKTLKRNHRLQTAGFPCSTMSPLAGMKVTSYALNALAVNQARRAGCDDALMLDTRRNIIGCATANVFWVMGGRLFTPDTRLGCRNGVTRERVLLACEALEIPVTMVRAKREILDDAEEIFVTSAVRGVRSVTEIDARRFRAGPVARRLRTNLEKEIPKSL